MVQKVIFTIIFGARLRGVNKQFVLSSLLLLLWILLLLRVGFFLSVLKKFWFDYVYFIFYYSSSTITALCSVTIIFLFDFIMMPISKNYFIPHLHTYGCPPVNKIITRQKKKKLKNTHKHDKKKILSYLTDCTYLREIYIIFHLPPVWRVRTCCRLKSRNAYRFIIHSYMYL